MFDRTALLIGKNNLDRINKLKVLVIGVGGVGGYVVETLVRSGVMNITIVDYDVIDITNINRQIIANKDNIGTYKVNAWKERINSINSGVLVNPINTKINEDNIDILFADNYDYIIDACDTISVKKLLIKLCNEKNIKLITVCGMGKRLDPSKVMICDIRDTSYDPIAKSLRKYVKDNNIHGKVSVVFSSEIPIKTSDEVIASMAMVPASAGILASFYVINDVLKENK